MSKATVILDCSLKFFSDLEFIMSIFGIIFTGNRILNRMNVEVDTTVI